MATATAMYHSGKNPLRRVKREGGDVSSPKSPEVRRLHKAFLRYHDPDGWPMLRQALGRMGRHDLIGPGKHQLIPEHQPAGWQRKQERKAGGKRFRTQHTGLPDDPRGPR